MNVAFRNTDGSSVLLVLNSTNEPRTFAVHAGNGYFRYLLPAGSVATFRW